MLLHVIRLRGTLCRQTLPPPMSLAAHLTQEHVHGTVKKVATKKKGPYGPFLFSPGLVSRLVDEFHRDLLVFAQIGYLDLDAHGTGIAFQPWLDVLLVNLFLGEIELADADGGFQHASPR